MKRAAFFRTATFRYAIAGFIFGCLFPIVAMVLNIWQNHLPFGFAALVDIQRNQNLIWIIDTAPVFLGLTFGIAGQREDRLLQIKMNLEQTVSERTSELQNMVDESHTYESQLKTANEQLESRAKELQLISEVARVMSMEQEISDLLPLIARLVSERFGFYHVGIFLLDEDRKFAVLKASNSPEGQRLLDRGHRLEVGQVGIVGNVASSGVSRIASDVGDDAVYFNNPNLPETRSEIALPLIVRKQIIGVIDVQSKDSIAYTQERANTLSILADQIAIAIENSRLFSETQQALNEAQAFSQQFSAQAWEKITRDQQIGYLHTPKGDKKITEPVDWEEARQAINKGEIVNLPENKGTSRGPALAVPLRLREQTIGVLDICSTDPNRVWQIEEVNIIRAIADRVSLALENARLFEETTGRANRERTVTDITTRLRSTTDPDAMLQTALNDLKHALGAKEIHIRPYTPPAQFSDLDENSITNGIDPKSATESK